MGYFSISASAPSASDGGPRCPFASLSTGSGVADRRSPAEQLRLTILGHVTNDINIFVGKETRAQGTDARRVRAYAPACMTFVLTRSVRLSPVVSGGGVLFSGVAASNLGMNVEVITKCSAEDRPVFQKIFAPRCVLDLYWRRLDTWRSPCVCVCVWLTFSLSRRVVPQWDQSAVPALAGDHLLRKQLPQAQLG
jgi:hypothetical protein